MFRRAVLPLLLLLAAAAFGAPTAEAAKFQPVLGEADGLSLVVRGEYRFQQIRFAPKAARAYRTRLAGRKVTIRCSFLRETKAGGFDERGGSSTSMSLPRKPRTIRLGTPEDSGHGDWCGVGWVGVPIAILPGTDVGRRYLDELTTTGRLFYLGTVASPNADDDPDLPVPVERVVKFTGGLFLALEGPDATPPPGKAGYWTDGNRAVFAATTLGGTRLFIDTRADSTTVTQNAALFLQADDRTLTDAVSLWRTADT